MNSDDLTTLMNSAKNNVYISVVSPVYQAEKTLPLLCERLNKTLLELTDKYEIILVDDRSRDRSWYVMKGLLSKYTNLVIMRLSRNFGQHYAFTAGLNVARGDWIVTLDCDLQEPPEEIPRLLEKAKSGYDIVLGRRVNRQHNFFKKLISNLFWKVFRVLSGYKMDNKVGSLRIMRRPVVEAFCSMKETYRMFGGMIEWLGFRTGYIDVKHARKEGESTYSIRRLLKLSIDGIVSFSNRPLYISIGIGMMFSLLSGSYAIYQICRYFIVGKYDVPGWLSIITATTFIGGLILFNQGILGLYLGRVYNECKDRPIYVVDQLLRANKAIVQRPARSLSEVN